MRVCRKCDTFSVCRDRMPGRSHGHGSVRPCWILISLYSYVVRRFACDLWNAENRRFSDCVGLRWPDTGPLCGEGRNGRRKIMSTVYRTQNAVLWIYGKRHQGFCSWISPFSFGGIWSVFEKSFPPSAGKHFSTLFRRLRNPVRRNPTPAGLWTNVRCRRPS